MDNNTKIRLWNGADDCESWGHVRFFHLENWPVSGRGDQSRTRTNRSDGRNYAVIDRTMFYRSWLNCMVPYLIMKMSALYSRHRIIVIAIRAPLNPLLLEYAAFLILYVQRNEYNAIFSMHDDHD